MSASESIDENHYEEELKEENLSSNKEQFNELSESYQDQIDQEESEKSNLVKIESHTSSLTTVPLSCPKS